MLINLVRQNELKTKPFNIDQNYQCKPYPRNGGCQNVRLT